MAISRPQSAFHKTIPTGCREQRLKMTLKMHVEPGITCLIINYIVGTELKIRTLLPNCASHACCSTQLVTRDGIEYFNRKVGKSAVN